MKNWNYNIRKSRIRRRTLFAIIFCLAIIMLYICYLRVDKLLRIQSGHNLNNTMKKVTQLTNLILDENWINLNEYSNRLRFYEPQSMEKACAVITQTEKERNREGDHLILFNGKNEYYYSGGGKFKWEHENVSSVENRKAFVGFFIEEGRSEWEQILFVMRLEEPLQIGEEIITHMGLVSDMEVLDEALSASVYGNINGVHIIDSEGAKIYHQTGGYDIFDATNMVNIIEGCHPIYGKNFDMAREEIKNSEPGCIHFVRKNVHYIVSYHPLEINDWQVILVVPGKVIGEGTKKLADAMLYYFGISATVVMMLIIIIMQMVEKCMKKKQEELNKRLKKVIEAEQNANQEKRQFLSQMSHDIRTPLNAIIGLISIVRENTENRSLAEKYLGKVHESAKHLNSLISDILDVSCIESGKMRLQYEKFSVKRVLHDCAYIMEGELEGTDITFRIDDEKVDHNYVFGDEIHLRQILLNLLSNSMKYTSSGGGICLIVEEKVIVDNKSVFCFKIVDNGIGMSKEYLKNIFSPFSREKNENIRQTKGAGLGMSIVSELVELLDGDIHVETRESIGTEYYVRIPFCYQMGQKKEEETEEYFSKKELSGMKVLVVEDNEINMEVVKYHLKIVGVEVTPARNGKEAVNLFMESSEYYFDAILMDIMMPVMDGLEAARTIRALNREDVSKICIIALSARAFREDMEISMKAGMNEHLTKPLQVEELWRVLIQYYREKKKEGKIKKVEYNINVV